MARPLQTVTALPAAAPRFGLLASNPPVTGEGRWMGGITYAPEGCIDGEYYDICDYGVPVTENDGSPTVQWLPYVLSVGFRCSTFSGLDEEEPRARRLMGQQAETLIGRELWSGAMTQTVVDSPNTWLASGDAETLSSGPVGLVHGLACLEQYLAENNGGRQGMIHATAQVVTHWESFRLLRRENNKILTFKDTVVVPSPGYLGTDPAGDIADDNVWAYATDMVRVFLGEVKVEPVRDSIDRRDNSVLALAQQPALAEWERCRHAGIQLAVSMCGGAS